MVPIESLHSVLFVHYTSVDVSSNGIKGGVQTRLIGQSEQPDCLLFFQRSSVLLPAALLKQRPSSHCNKQAHSNKSSVACYTDSRKVSQYPADKNSTITHFISTLTISVLSKWELFYELCGCATKWGSVQHSALHSSSCWHSGCAVSFFSCSFHGDKMKGTGGSTSGLADVMACCQSWSTEWNMALFGISNN